MEYRTAAGYHACDSALAFLDTVQDKVLRAAGMSRVEALKAANLAPLAVRRDIAMLGIIHRTVLGKGPKQFGHFFKEDIDARREGRGRHQLQLLPLPDDVSDFMLPGSRPANYIQNSAFGLINIYNRLPPDVVEASRDVTSFQRGLQQLVLSRAEAGCHDWELTLSPRIPLHRHPLRCLR